MLRCPGFSRYYRLSIVPSGDAFEVQEVVAGLDEPPKSGVHDVTLRIQADQRDFAVGSNRY